MFIFDKHKFINIPILNWNNLFPINASSNYHFSILISQRRYCLVICVSSGTCRGLRVGTDCLPQVLSTLLCFERFICLFISVCLCTWMHQVGILLYLSLPTLGFLPELAGVSCSNLEASKPQHSS